MPLGPPHSTAQKGWVASMYCTYSSAPHNSEPIKSGLPKADLANMSHHVFFAGNGFKFIPAAFLAVQNARKAG